MSVKIRQYKRGGWEVDIRFDWPDGSAFRERRRAPTNSRSATQRWAEARARELILAGKPKPLPITKEVPTLREFSPKFIEGYAKANRQKASGVASKLSVLNIHLLPRFGDTKLDAITTEDVDLLKGALTKRSPKTVNNVLTVLNKLLKVAVEWRVIDRLPCNIRLLKRPPGQASFYEAEVYEQLVEAAAKVDPVAHLLVLLGGDAGLRRGEIVGLRWSDVDLRRQQLNVSRSIVIGVEALPKGGKPRVVPMTQALVAALTKHRHLRGDRVVCQDDGSPLTPKMVRMAMQKAQRRAGFEPNGRIHVLRHTFCSQLAMRGAPAMAIKELAGHESVTTTAIYMHLSPAARESAIKLLDEARRPAPRGDILETGRIS